MKRIFSKILEYFEDAIGPLITLILTIVLVIFFLISIAKQETQETQETPETPKRKVVNCYTNSGSIIKSKQVIKPILQITIKENKADTLYIYRGVE